MAPSKTTLMNLMTGLPAARQRNSSRVLGVPPSDAERLSTNVGHCSQFDALSQKVSAATISCFLDALRPWDRQNASPTRSRKMIERVGLTEAAKRKIAGYSKGMRQRIKLALAIAHEPQVLVLDEPLNGLDPMARSEVTELFRTLAASGMHVVISSHILHEVDMISDRVTPS